MARPREFDEDKALDGAMNVFWEHGYQEASLAELLKGMGLTRGSLYKAYKDKKSLFIIILQRYDAYQVEKATNLLSDEQIKDGVERIETLFLSILQAVESNNFRGCLLCSAAAGPAYNDREIAKSVHTLLDKMQSGFRVALQQSSKHQALSSAKIEQLANLLLTQYIGLRILSRSRASKETLKRSIASLKLLLTSV